MDTTNENNRNSPVSGNSDNSINEMTDFAKDDDCTGPSSPKQRRMSSSVSGFPTLLQGLHQRSINPCNSFFGMQMQHQQQLQTAVLLLGNKELPMSPMNFLNQKANLVNPTSAACSQMIQLSELQKVNQESLAEYTKFRDNMLRQFAANKMRLQRGTFGDGTLSPSSDYSNDEIKDKSIDAYWERRKKNNEAAKRSRDARRAKEDEVAIRAAFLEQENVQLKFTVAKLKSETEKLKKALINFGSDSGFEST